MAKSGFSGAQLKRSAAAGRTCKACVAASSSGGVVSEVVVVVVPDTRTEAELMQLLLCCADGKMVIVKQLATQPGVDIDRGEAKCGQTAVYFAAFDGQVHVLTYLVKERRAM